MPPSTRAPLAPVVLCSSSFSPQHRLACQPGEGRGFDLQRRQAPVRAGSHLAHWAAGRCRRRIRWVLSAPPPHTIKRRRSGCMAQHVRGAGPRREFRQGRLHVGRCGAGEGAQVAVAARPVEQVAAGALGWRLAEIRLGQQAVPAAPAGPGRSRPRRLPRRRACPCAARTSYPSAHCRDRSRSPASSPSGAQQRDVGDAADVEHAYAFRRAAPNQAWWKKGASGAPWPPGRDVAAAKVGDHGDARQFRQQRRLAQLERVAGAVEFLRPVAHGLAVGADGPHRCRRLRRRWPAARRPPGHRRA